MVRPRPLPTTDSSAVRTVLQLLSGRARQCWRRFSPAGGFFRFSVNDEKKYFEHRFTGWDIRRVARDANRFPFAQVGVQVDAW